jgi:ATP-binding cassette subfamily A (ABC1) protein 3
MPQCLFGFVCLQASAPSAALIAAESQEKEDIDVAAERERIARAAPNPSGEPDTIVLKNLRKVYPARSGGPAIIAVDKTSLGIPTGQCFALLGVNGAGKTTTLKMLTGDTEPTDGSALINGFDIRTQLQDVRRETGYCPQTDPLLELMTGRESLTMYARLRGFPESAVAPTVNSLLRTLGLDEHSDKTAGSYSGGTKRKLSLGLALIGDPSVVFLVFMFCLSVDLFTLLTSHVLCDAG